MVADESQPIKKTETPIPVPILWLGESDHFTGIETVRALRQLDYQKKIKLWSCPRDLNNPDYTVQLARSLKPELKAIVLRPTTWPNIPIEPDDVLPECLMVNIGVGTEHLAQFLNQRPDSLILADPLGPAAKLSAKVVAQLTVTLAICLLRRIVPAACLVGQDVDDFHNQYPSLIKCGTLIGKHWLCLAAGKQTRELLPLLKAFGVSRVTIWDRQTDQAKLVEKFRTCIGLITSETSITSDFSLVDQNSDFAISITNDYNTVLPGVDIVSIHAGSTSSETGTTPLPLNITFFSQMKKSAIVINTSRGIHVVEKDVVSGLEDKVIAGYGTDVLSAPAERYNDPDFSPLWRHYRKLCRESEAPPLERANLVILPHIGGSVEPLFAAFLDELIPKMLKQLQLV